MNDLQRCVVRRLSTSNGEVLAIVKHSDWRYYYARLYLMMRGGDLVDMTESIAESLGMEMHDTDYAQADENGYVSHYSGTVKVDGAEHAPRFKAIDQGVVEPLQQLARRAGEMLELDVRLL